MPLTIPPSVNYPNPLYFQPNAMLAAYGNPPEGAGSINVEIDWGTMGGASECVQVSPNANTINQNQISVIAAIYCDNSDSQAAVRFVFPDTGLTVTIPSFSGALFPVVTGGTSFYVEAGSAIATDTTRFLILNVNPPPVDFAQPPAMQEAAVNNNVSPAAGTTALIANTVDGTLRNINVYYNLGASVAGNYSSWQLKDGAGNVLAGGQFSDNLSASNMSTNALGMSLNDLDLPFINGANFVITSIFGAGFSAHAGIAVTLIYETP